MDRSILIDLQWNKDSRLVPEYLGNFRSVRIRHGQKLVTKSFLNHQIHMAYMI